MDTGSPVSFRAWQARNMTDKGQNMYGRKAWTVVAYAYEADIHCVGCAEERFPQLAEPMPVDWHATDSEGNPVRPVFSSDYEGGDYCGDCFALID